MSDHVAFDPVPIVAALERHGVRFVVIGGIAARLAGAPIVTGDLDVTPATDEENLDRLVAALADLGATFRIGSVTTDEAITAKVIAENDHVQASTPHGDLDIVVRPAGTSGFDDLSRGARREKIAPRLSVSVAALSDVIRSKEAAGRAKDRGQLPILRETLERIGRG
jgi:hypothetical protein